MCKDWIWRNKCTKSLEYKYLTQKMSFYQHIYRLICHFMMLLPMSFINEKVLQHLCNSIRFGSYLLLTIKCPLYVAVRHWPQLRLILPMCLFPVLVHGA